MNNTPISRKQLEAALIALSAKAEHFYNQLTVEGCDNDPEIFEATLEGVEGWSHLYFNKLEELATMEA